MARPTVSRWWRRPRALLAEATGVEALVAAPPPVPVREIFRRFWPDARPYRHWLWLTLLFVAVGPAIDAALIWLYKLLIDTVLVPGDLGPFPPLVLAYVGLTLLNGLVGFGDRYLMAWIGERFLVNLRTRFFRHLQTLSLDFYAGRQLGDIIARLTGDVAAIEGLVLTGVADAIAYGLRLIILAGLLFWLQWDLALIALLVAPVFWLTARLLAGRLRAIARERRRRGGSISAVAEEGLSNIALVQAYNREDRISDRFHRENLGNMAAQLAATRLKALFGPLVDLTELAGVLVVVAVGAWSLADGRLSLGGLLVFLAYLNQLYSPVRRLSNLTTTVYTASASAERIIEFLDQRPAAEQRPDARVPAPVVGQLEFDRVGFQYATSRRPVLEEVSLRLSPGEALAIVGGSGAGKSTLAKLLLRFYDPTSGQIRLDGVDLRQLDLPALRDQIAVVFQETALFDGTVRDNIAFGRPDTSEAAIVAAARAADADAFIRTLPEGYDTIIGQQGRRLSGGQRQRLAIARALVRQAPVLILDEPTASLDSATARRLYTPLVRLMDGRTTLIITHDLTLASAASRVVVLEAGRVVEQGTPAALLRGQGRFAQLVQGDRGASQALADADPADGALTAAEPTDPATPEPALTTVARAESGPVGATTAAPTQTSQAPMAGRQRRWTAGLAWLGAAVMTGLGWLAALPRRYRPLAGTAPSRRQPIGERALLVGGPVVLLLAALLGGLAQTSGLSDAPVLAPIRSAIRVVVRPPAALPLEPDVALAAAPPSPQPLATAIPTATPSPAPPTSTPPPSAPRAAEDDRPDRQGHTGGIARPRAATAPPVAMPTIPPTVPTTVPPMIPPTATAVPPAPPAPSAPRPPAPRGPSAPKDDRSGERRDNSGPGSGNSGPGGGEDSGPGGGSNSGPGSGGSEDRRGEDNSGPGSGDRSGSGGSGSSGSGSGDSDRSGSGGSGSGGSGSGDSSGKGKSGSGSGGGDDSGKGKSGSGSGGSGKGGRDGK